ncbi:hypothetical protein SESBI_46356 [Sesbania bispinosa]|nr:hypothetical protein SESBI_46356 [Sesbania bispinosa]
MEAHELGNLFLGDEQANVLLPLCWVLSGALAALACVIAKWVFVGRKKAGETVPIWSPRIIMDNILK